MTQEKLNKKKAIALVNKLIANESKVVFTAICHLEEYGFQAVAKQLIGEAQEYQALLDYLEEKLQ